jgi:DNA-binding NarL/FixJ family response regulator
MSISLEKQTILTSRELQCAYYLLEGMTAKGIASQLNISHRTIEAHIDNIKHKLSCKNKIQLVLKLASLFIH